MRYAKGDRMELARNDAYWGAKAAWDKVTLRIITADPTRVAALLAGDVRAIENVPTADIARIAKSSDLTLYRTVSHRLMYLHLDSDRERSPFVTDKAGKPLEKNPLKDLRVRRAISKAINRQALVERVMEGAAVSTGRLMPEGLFGYSSALKLEPYDVEGAKKLLAEAGYPDGFGLTLHAPNNRYVNDEQIAQAIAQLLARVGIATRVDAMPSSVFFRAAASSSSASCWSAGVRTLRRRRRRSKRCWRRSTPRKAWAPPIADVTPVSKWMTCSRRRWPRWTTPGVNACCNRPLKSQSAIWALFRSTTSTICGPRARA